MKKLNSTESTQLLLKIGRSTHVLQDNEIVWIKSYGNYTTIVLKQNKRLVSRLSLTEFELRLTKGSFIRIHKSYIANKKEISQVNSSYLIIQNEKLPIGRKYQKSTLELFE